MKLSRFGLGLLLLGPVLHSSESAAQDRHFVSEMSEAELSGTRLLYPTGRVAFDESHAAEQEAAGYVVIPDGDNLRIYWELEYDDVILEADGSVKSVQLSFQHEDLGRGRPFCLTTGVYAQQVSKDGETFIVFARERLVPGECPEVQEAVEETQEDIAAVTEPESEPEPEPEVEVEPDEGKPKSRKQQLREARRKARNKAKLARQGKLYEEIELKPSVPEIELESEEEPIAEVEPVPEPEPEPELEPEPEPEQEQELEPEPEPVVPSIDIEAEREAHDAAMGLFGEMQAEMERESARNAELALELEVAREALRQAEEREVDPRYQEAVSLRNEILVKKRVYEDYKKLLVSFFAGAHSGLARVNTSDPRWIGPIEWPDGSKYQGRFVDDIPHDMGIYTDLDGNAHHVLLNYGEGYFYAMGGVRVDIKWDIESETFKSEQSTAVVSLDLEDFHRMAAELLVDIRSDEDRLRELGGNYLYSSMFEGGEITDEERRVALKELALYAGMDERELSALQRKCRKGGYELVSITVYSGEAYLSVVDERGRVRHIVARANNLPNGYKQAKYPIGVIDDHHIFNEIEPGVLGFVYIHADSGKVNANQLVLERVLNVDWSEGLEYLVDIPKPDRYDTSEIIVIEAERGGWPFGFFEKEEKLSDEALDAEHRRLREEMQDLAQRNKWNAVERKYQDLLALESQGVTLNYIDYYRGAEAARGLGDVAATYERLKKAEALASAEDIEQIQNWIKAIENNYSPVVLLVVGSDSQLELDMMPMFPDQRSAIEFAMKELEEEGYFEGLLPIGVEYTFSGHTFSLEQGGGEVRIPDDIGRERRKRGRERRREFRERVSGDDLDEGNGRSEAAVSRAIITCPESVEENDGVFDRPTGEDWQVLQESHEAMTMNMKSMVSQKNWKGVEKTYQKILEMKRKGIEISFYDYSFAAQAAMARGDINTAYERFLKAEELGMDETVRENLEYLETGFGMVRLCIDPSYDSYDKLQVITETFRPDQKRYIDVAIEELQDTNTYIGLLPVGLFEFCGSTLKVDSIR